MHPSGLVVTDLSQLQIRPGEVARVWMGVSASWLGPVDVPLFIARGRVPGPKFVAIACQHGDEVYGVLGLLDLMREINADTLRGELWILPCMNTPAFTLGMRVSVFDHQDMNRVHPGRPDGTFAEQIAHRLATQILPGADLLLDLHGGSPEVGDIAFGRWTDAPGKDSVLPIVSSLDLDFLVTPADTSLGSLGSVTPQLGVPLITIEAGSCVRYAHENAREMARFVRACMQCLGMVDGPRPKQRALAYMRTVSHRCAAGGAFKTLVAMGERVTRGQVVGNVFNLLGEVVQTVEAPEDGIVTVMRTGVRVHPGESLVTVAVPTHPPAG